VVSISRRSNRQLEPPHLNCKENGGKLAMKTTKDKESPKLLPCPFCGAEAEIVRGGDEYEFVVSVNCTECSAHVRETDDHIGRDMDALEAAAVAAWNRRTGEARP
jgi:Lar family restriction alleviation protein